MTPHIIVIAFFVSLVISLIALWRKSLTTSGALAATLVGTLILGIGGIKWGILLFFFFLSSSLLSKYKSFVRKDINDLFEKGDQRDHMQVLANGGAAALVASISPFFSNELELFILFIGLISTVTADTWATEIGTLVRQPTRLITNLKPCPQGQSGGISVFGSLSSIMAGVFIGGIAGIMLGGFYWQLILIASLSGAIGSLIDSLLGATIQRSYFCHGCQQHTERQKHCSEETEFTKGLKWMNNDLVNFLSSLVGGASAVILLLLFFTNS